jgi:hypothetical protein
MAVHDGKDFFADHPSESELPWYVVLLLGAHSKKHVFACSKLQKSVVRERLCDFSNRVKWAAHYKDSAQVSSAKPLVKRRVPECQKLVPAVVGGLVGAVGTSVNRVCGRLCGRSSRLPPYVSAARRWLRSRNLLCIPSDKDGVFTIISRSFLNQLIHVELSKPSYRAYGPLNLEPDFGTVRRLLRKAASVADRLVPGWGQEFQSMADRATSAQLVDRLLATVKTHKHPLSVRLIHSSTNNCLNGLGEALNRILGPRCREIDHLCVSSDDVVAKLRGIHLGARALLLKQDIKDFYLAGSHPFIMQQVAASLQGLPEHDFVVSALNVLLPYQYVKQSFDVGSETHTVYRVQNGCGIGRNYAGALADWLFFAVVEKHLVPQFGSFGVRLYLRFRDDLLCVLSDLSLSPAYRNAMSELSSVYCVVGLETYSLVGVPFLDLFVFKSVPEGDGLLRHRVHVKPTARHIPLSSSSYHPKGVHKSWPIAEMQRMARRCDVLSTSRFFQEQKLARFRWFLLDPAVLETCRVWRARQGSAVARSVVRGEGGILDRRRVVRLILPYRRELSSFPFEVAAIWNRYSSLFVDETGLSLDIRVSWSRAGRPLSNLLLW